MQTYATFLVRRAWLVLVALAVATVVVGSGVGKLRAEYDVETSLPQDHPFVLADKTIRKEFGGRNTIIAMIVPREGDVWRTDVLEVVRDATIAALRLDDIIGQNVVSLAAPSVRYIEDNGGALTVDYLMTEPPQTLEEIAALRAKVESDPQLRGMVVTPDQRAAVLVLDFWESAKGTALAERVLSLAEPFRDRPVDFYFAGEPMLALSDANQSEEIEMRMPFIFLVIALMLLASFRNLQGMLIPMLTAVLSVIWGLGLMGHTGIVIDTWNMATPVLLIAIAAGHSAQMLKRYIEEVARLGDNKAAVVATMVRMGPVMIAAGGVAALGFASLALTGIPAIVRFGLACSYGIGSAVLLEMTFIPALRSVLPAPRARIAKGGVTGWALTMLERAVLDRRGRSVLIATGVALILAVAGATQVRTYGAMREYMAENELPREHLEKVEEHFPGTVTMTVMYEGPPDTVKQVPVLQHMEALRAELESDPIVWRTTSLADLIKMLHKTFNGEAPDPYRVPEDQELVSQLVFLGDSPAFERFIDRGYTKSLMTFFLTDDDTARIGPLVRRASAWVEANPPPEGVRVLIAGGAGPTMVAVNEHTTESKILNILMVLLAIYAVSSLVLRSPVGGLYVILPIAVSLVLLLGMIGWIGIRLDMGSATMMAMSAGIGADYAIYFLYRLREERVRAANDEQALHAALQTSGRAVIFVAASIAAGFSMMGLFSAYYGLRLFGSLIPISMVFSCLAALSLMPVLALRMRPAFLFGPGEGETEDGLEARPAVS